MMKCLLTCFFLSVILQMCFSCIPCFETVNYSLMNHFLYCWYWLQQEVWGGGGGGGGGIQFVNTQKLYLSGHVKTSSRVWDKINNPVSVKVQNFYSCLSWQYFLTSLHSIVVNALDCRLEGLGIESHQIQSHVGFFSSGWLLPRAGSAIGPMGRLEPHRLTAKLHPLHGCVFENVALITWPTLQVPHSPGLGNTRIIMTVSVVCSPVK